MPYHDARYFFLSKLKRSFLPNKMYYRLWIRWNCFRHVKGLFGKNEKKGENKFTLFWVMFRCFRIEGEKGALMRTRRYSCSWINNWFGLLLLLDYYVFVLMRIGSWEVWKNTRKMAILVFLDLESELCLGQKYFLSWKWKRKKLSKSAICPVLQYGGFDTRIQSCHG